MFKLINSVYGKLKPGKIADNYQYMHSDIIVIGGGVIGMNIARTLGKWYP